MREAKKDKKIIPKMKTLSSLSVLIVGLLFLSTQVNSQITEDRLRNFKQIIHGNWIPVKYFNEIKRTKSPIKSSKNSYGYSQLTIDTSKIIGDSLAVEYIMNGGHEGGDFLIWVRNGQTPNAVPTNIHDVYKIKSSLAESDPYFYELGFEINKSDTSLILLYYNKDKKLLNKYYFVRVSEFTQFINSALIVGKYLLQDSGSIIEFTESGQIIGFDKFQQYSIQTDFVVTRDNNIDNIYFDVYSKMGKRFTFKIKKT